MVCTTIIFAFTKHALAAWYCGLAPLAALAYFFMFGFHPNSGTVDHVVILVLVGLWLRYSWRVVNIGMSFEDMLEGEARKKHDDW